jgi:hypothetical protein
VAGNESNFFVRDATHGSALVFRIQPDAPSNSLTIRDSGNVGIGTWAPDAGLHVSRSAGNLLRLESDSGTVDPNFEIKSTGGSTTQRWQVAVQRNTGAFFLGDATYSRFPFEIAANTTTQVEIDNTGLKVNGTTLNVPDYVFEEDYPLMSLAHLQMYVAREKHLPNMPSAEDIMEDGLNLNQFQMRLLEKIEELTLYTFGQQEQIAALEARVEALEAIVESLSQVHSDGS